jgi:transaldolase
MWINNPTPREAELAIAAGAISCTTNPTYASKQIAREESHRDAIGIVDNAVQADVKDERAADLVQQQLVQRIMETFLPLYKARPGEEGFVSIQGNPFRDDDPDFIVEEAKAYRRLGENFISKIPVTQAGLKAIEALIGEGVPIIATEVMSLSQAIHACELYQRVSERTEKYPPFYITHITGIFDQYLQETAEKEAIEISAEALRQAGCIVAKKQYRILKERNFRGIMLGGGARSLHHFTEMVGSEMHITINWEGTADRLMDIYPPVENRMEVAPARHIVEELQNKLSAFRAAYSEYGLAVEDFARFGPVMLFRDMFVQGWRSLLETIRERRSRSG